MPGERVLLLVDEYYASLAAVRALAAGGYAPIVGATTADGYAHRSRAARAVVRLPSPELQGFADAVGSAARQHGADVVMPATEATLVALAGRGDELAPSILAAPSREALSRVADKRTLAVAAAAAGLATPPSRVVRSSTLDAGTLSFPAVVKPLWSALVDGGVTRALPKAVRVSTREQLELQLALHRDVEWLVQPYVHGSLLAVAALAWRGELLVAVQQRARRIFPRDCGVSAYAETVAPDEVLLGRLGRLVAEVALDGLFEAQFVAAGNERFLIDVNPRAYGSLALAVAAGANLPAGHVDLVLGRRPVFQLARHPVRFRAEPGELAGLADALRRGDRSAAAAIAMPRPHTTHAVVSVRDPAPAAYLIRRIVSHDRNAQRD